MTLVVYTARISYVGIDKLDVTRKSANEDGIVFAPSWKILPHGRFCYCRDPAHCHRTLLADILGKLGAEVRGERDGRRPR